MRERRAFLRNLLSRLIAERTDSGGLYIPRGEEGMRRMVRHLIAMRTPRGEDMQIEADIQAFLNIDKQAQDAASSRHQQ